MPVSHNAPMFSIVSVIRNIASREGMFRRSVESVLNQTVSDFEYIIQDGGSTDATAEIVAGYRDPRIHFVSASDSGPEEGFFRALKRCRGTYIGTCLSDEELLPDALENARRAFEDHRQIAAFYGDVSYVNERGEKWGPRVPPHPFFIEAYVCQVLVPPFCSSFFRREAVEKAGLHEHPWRCTIGEFEFWIRIADVGEIIYQPCNISCFGRHARSNTRTAGIYDRLLVAREQAMPALFRENRILQECNVSVEQAIAGNYAWGADGVFSIEGLSEKCERFIRQAERYDPKSPQLARLMSKVYGEARTVQHPTEPSIKPLSSVPAAAAAVTTPEELKRLVLRECPGLDETLGRGDIHRAVDILRDWTSRNVVVSDEAKSFWPTDVVSTYRIFSGRHGGTWCRGTAMFHTMILNLFGIPATRLGYTYCRDSALSHAVTVFADRTSALPRFYVSDAYFNLDYRDADSDAPVELSELFQRIGRHEYDSIRIRERAAMRPCVVDVGVDVAGFWYYPDGHPGSPRREPDRWIYPDADVTLASLVNREPTWRREIAERRGNLTTTEFLFQLMLQHQVFDPFACKELTQALTEQLDRCRTTVPIQCGQDTTCRHESGRDDTDAANGPQATEVARRSRGGGDTDDDQTTELLARWIEALASMDNRLYYRDQSVETLRALSSQSRCFDPTVIVELGTLAGLSLRTWVTSSERAKIYAVDLSFAKLRETMSLLPVDLSRVTLLEQDILKTDFASLWTPQDRVIFFVDAHDLPNVPIMNHVLATALPSLPEGSMVIVDDLWFSRERLTQETARGFLENRVVGEIDELQCFEGHFAPYHEGGSFMGFAEVLPLLDVVNEHGIPLACEEGSKHVRFVWKKEYLACRRPRAERAEERGCVVHNPLTYVPTAPALADEMHRLACDYRAGKIRDVAQALVNLVTQHPHDAGVAYSLAVCMARGGMLTQARDLLASGRSDSDHPRYRRLLNDLVQGVAPSRCRDLPASGPEPKGEPGLTIFAMPKAFSGHIATIQKNAIRSWTRLKPAPEILLFGDEPGIREMAKEIGARHIPQVDRNEFGTPLVNKLFEAAEVHASHAVMAYVNADMILFQSFVDGAMKVRSELSEFLLIGQRWDIPILDEIDFHQPQWQWRLQEQMAEHAMLHAECGLDYFVFPKGLYREIPPFAIGRTAWDNWLVMAPHTYGAAVVDGTEFITAVHQDHDYGHVVGGREEAWSGVEAARNRQLIQATDNSGRTSGATWALKPEGILVRMEPRQPWHLTAVYRDERSIWLLKQADRLMAVGREELAACKCEEALVLLEALLAFCQLGRVPRESLDAASIAKRYATCCTRLAQCCLKMGASERSAAAYTRLLENPVIQIPKAQRDEIARRRDDLLRVAHEAMPSAPSDGPNGESKTAPSTDRRPGREENSSASSRCLQARISNAPESHEPQSLALAGLEEKYRKMPDGTRAKHAMAVRLSDVFRRAGLIEKSAALAMEAEALKGCRSTRPLSCRPADCCEPDAAGRMPLGQDPKITVVTTCRNGQRYLSECLDSILNQTMPQWQLFLLDDGSTDGTRRIMEAYAARDARIKPFYFDDASGPYIRRNFAIERTDTPFVMIQDADDIMCPEKLQRLHEAIAKDERLGVVGSFYRRFLEEFSGIERTETTTLSTAHEEILEIYRSELLWDYSWHGSAIVRRSLFDAIGVYDENPFGADSFWLAKAAEYACHTGKIRLCNIPEFLTLRRVHDDSQTGRLPTIDPRSRRAHYWQYCLGKLQEAAREATRHSHAEFARRLRECTCGDFLQRFGAQIEAWENEPLDARFVPRFLQGALQCFKAQRYVTSIRALDGLETMEPAIASHVPNFDLVKAMAFYGLGLPERCQVHLRREMVNHDNPTARQVHEDLFERRMEIDLQRWYAEHADSLVLEPLNPSGAGPAMPVDTATERPPKVTVITACRNAEPFLAECLESLLSQSLVEWELFLLDDGSTDGTRQLIEAYAARDARIQPFYFDDSRGPYVRRNFAIERARADFVVIQDADDIMCPTKLATLYAEIGKDDRLAMVGTNYRTFLEKYIRAEYSEYNRLPLTNDEIMARFKSWCHAMSHRSAIIRKALFAEIGLYDENPFAADSFWSAKLALYAEAGGPICVKNVPECLTLIRMHAGNHTRLLSTLDPRNRRTRYRQYSEYKLQAIRDRRTSEPEMEIARELRRCTCSDFLTRFKAQIIAWEAEPLDVRVIPEFLQSAVRLFNQGYYVSCANVLNDVEAFEPAINDRVMGYDLLRGMAFFAVQIKETARMCLDREIRCHDNPAAHRFVEDAFESGAPVDVQSWCQEHAEEFPIGLEEVEPGKSLQARRSVGTI